MKNKIKRKKKEESKGYPFRVKKAELKAIAGNRMNKWK